jgi:hypothetical protein
MLVNAFKANVFPYLVQIGVILLVYSLCQSGYSLYRDPNWQKFLDKLKASLVAYATVKGSWVIVSFFDKLIDGLRV